MAGQIFISHSKDDQNVLEPLDKVFGKAELKQYRASFEDQHPPVSQELKHQINDSIGMFVVLGRNAQSKTHTMIWIGWEAGIAIQAGIPVWILEDTQSNVSEPIPSFTDYVLWDSGDVEQRRTLRDSIQATFVDDRDPNPIEQLDPETKERNWGNSRNAANVRDSAVSTEVRTITCPYDSCGESFRIRFEGPNEFNCPSCRQTIVLESNATPF